MHVQENQGARGRRNEETVFPFLQMILLSVQDATSVNDHYALQGLSKVSKVGDPCDSVGD
jgi:hypothetical protein